MEFEEAIAHAARGSCRSLVLADIDVDGSPDAVSSGLAISSNVSGDP